MTIKTEERNLPSGSYKKTEEGKEEEHLNFLRKDGRTRSSLGRYVFGSEISYNKAPPRLPGLGC